MGGGRRRKEAHKLVSEARRPISVGMVPTRP